MAWSFLLVLPSFAAAAQDRRGRKTEVTYIEEERCLLRYRVPWAEVVHDVSLFAALALHQHAFLSLKRHHFYYVFTLTSFMTP